MTTNRSMPVMVLAAGPTGFRNAEKFAAGIREYATQLDASGIAFVSAHWDRSSDSSNVIVEVADVRPDEGPAFSSELPVPSASAFALSERVAELLQECGLTSEFGRRWPRNDATWAAMVAVHAGAPVPLIHVSVPARLGSEPMRTVTRALGPLRDEGVLLVGISPVFAEAIRGLAERTPGEHREVAHAVEGVPV